jgi:hypothetical protein
MKNPSTTPIANQTRTQVTKRMPDVQEQIRVRAYGLYEQHGKEGREVEDWLQAESEITQQQAKTLAA